MRVAVQVEVPEVLEGLARTRLVQLRVRPRGHPLGEAPEQLLPGWPLPRATQLVEQVAMAFPPGVQLLYGAR